MSGRILVTGFGPFPGMPVNPTEALVDRIGATHGVDTMAFATRWAACGDLAERAARYDAVLMFGVASQARRIRYERRAQPACEALPDADGRLPDAAPSREVHSGLPVRRLAALARAAGYPVCLSRDAGRYICNASYAAALEANPRTLFVHVPVPTEDGPVGERTLLLHARWLVRQLLRELDAPELRPGPNGAGRARPRASAPSA